MLEDRRLMIFLVTMAEMVEMVVDGVDGGSDGDGDFPAAGTYAGGYCKTRGKWRNFVNIP